jgi:hypothetical protein
MSCTWAAPMTFATKIGTSAFSGLVCDKLATVGDWVLCRRTRGTGLYIGHVRRECRSELIQAVDVYRGIWRLLH